MFCVRISRREKNEYVRREKAREKEGEGGGLGEASSGKGRCATSIEPDLLRKRVCSVFRERPCVYHAVKTLVTCRRGRRTQVRNYNALVAIRALSARISISFMIPPCAISTNAKLLIRRIPKTIIFYPKSFKIHKCSTITSASFIIINKTFSSNFSTIGMLIVSFRYTKIIYFLF